MIKETSYELAKEIPSGSKIAIFKDSSVPMTLGLNMIKSGITDLEIVTVPTGGPTRRLTYRKWVCNLS